MQETIWALVILFLATMPLSAQQTTARTQRIPPPQTTQDEVKSQHRATQQASPTCKDLKAIGAVLDDEQKLDNPNRGEVDGILAAIVGVEKYFAEPSAHDADETWDTLANCANQTQSGSQRAEAFRVAAMWEHWRAQTFQKAYRKVLPIPAPACKDLTKLDSQAAALMPSDESGTSYRLPDGATRLMEALSKCGQESLKLNEERSVPEYVKAELDLWAMQHLTDLDYKNRILAGNGSLITEYNGLVGDYNRLVDLLKEKSQELNEAYIQSLRQATLWQLSIPQPVTCTGEFRTYGTWGTANSTCQ